MAKTERNTWEETRSIFKDDQRRSIVASALTILMEEGTPGLTMANLAHQAGISRQTLYRYFPDLDAVLMASVDGLAEADAEFRRAVLDGDEPREQLHRAVDMMIDAAGHGGRIQEFLAALPPDARAGIQAHHARTVNLLSDILSTMRRQRRSPYRGDPHVDAELIIGLVSAGDDGSRERVHSVVDLILNAQPS